MLDKAQLGTRYTCFQCGTKFYDLNRPTPTCPECSADQREAPAQDIKALLGGGGATRRYTQDDEEASGEAAPEEDDDLGLLGGDEESDRGSEDEEEL